MGVVRFEGGRNIQTKEVEAMFRQVVQEQEDGRVDGEQDRADHEDLVRARFARAAGFMDAAGAVAVGFLGGQVNDPCRDGDDA